MTPTSLPVDAVLVALTAIIIQVLKPLLELAVSPAAPLHDPLIRLFAVLLGIGLMLLDHGVPADGPGVVALLGYGLGTGLAAIGTYHLIADSPVQTPRNRAELPQDATKRPVGL